MLYVTDAKYVGEFRVWLAFSDGTVGEADLKDSLSGPVFEPPKDERLFSQVRLDPDADTIAWPNGADFAPEYLHEIVMRHLPAAP